MNEFLYGIAVAIAGVITLVGLAVIVIVTIIYIKGMGAQKKIDRIDFVVKKDKLRSERESGIIYDSDTVLADIMQNADYEITGLAKEVFEIYKKTSDKEAFENLFYSLSGETFENYIGQCEKA